MDDLTVGLQSTLEAGEWLLWSGQPKQGLLFRPSDLLLVPFSLMWGGFAIFWECMALHITSRGGHSPGAIQYVMPLWGIPFVLVGLYLIGGRFFTDRIVREKTIYGVTDRRVILISGLFSRSVRSLDLRNLPEITLTERSDGSGTIAFGGGGYGGYTPFGQSMQGWPGAGRNLPPSFDLIPSAKSVYDLIRSAQREAGR